jgi:squalene-hopene/tetraprenyl-beta-curcumene cyclase
MERRWNGDWDADWDADETQVDAVDVEGVESPMAKPAGAIALVFAGVSFAAAQTPPASTTEWNSRAAAAYLDGRMDWWLKWPNAIRDQGTTCVSCHTVAPYALARPALRITLGERDVPEPERTMRAHAAKRVELWKELPPLYPDQRYGLPKSSESRGTEAVMSALVLALRDRETGVMADDTRAAFANLWALQFTAGSLKGAWAWLHFHLEPWESDDGPYYGASLAAVAVAAVPGYASDPQVQTQMQMLRNYLQQGVDKTSLFNRANVLWAASLLPDLLTTAQRDAVVEALITKQQEDGGWSMASLGGYKRSDNSVLDTASDGYATGVVTLALRRAATSAAQAPVERGLAWLRGHQDAATGMWRASSLNKQRDPASDVGKFMSDAATAYAALALADGPRVGPTRNR